MTQLKFLNHSDLEYCYKENRLKKGLVGKIPNNSAQSICAQNFTSIMIIQHTYESTLIKGTYTSNSL